MYQTIKIIDSYIKESEAIFKKNNSISIKEQNTKIKNELGIKADLDDLYLMNHKNSFEYRDKQILVLLIKRMKNFAQSY